MRRRLGPVAWAHRLSSATSPDTSTRRFPVDVREAALVHAAGFFRSDPLVRLEAADLPGLEGVLVRIPNGKGWGIAYRDIRASSGRVRFTIAHEIGHYLMHREISPGGILCTTDDIFNARPEKADIEREANAFAAEFLVPRDDLKLQIAAREAPTLDSLIGCANRYGTSLLAVTLQWISCTELPAIVVASRDGFLLWARSSASALRDGLFLSAKAGPVELPRGSLAESASDPNNQTREMTHGPQVWFGRSTRELSLNIGPDDRAVFLILPE